MVLVEPVIWEQGRQTHVSPTDGCRPKGLYMPVTHYGPWSRWPLLDRSQAPGLGHWEIFLPRVRNSVVLSQVRLNQGLEMDRGRWFGLLVF